MAEIDTLNIGGIDYTIKDSVARSSGVANLIAYTENGTTASQSFPVKGTPINWKGTLYYTKTAVAKGDTWAVNTNLKLAGNLGRLTRNIDLYVGSDGKLHFTDLTGADTALNFSGPVNYTVVTQGVYNSGGGDVYSSKKGDLLILTGDFSTNFATSGVEEVLTLGYVQRISDGSGQTNSLRIYRTTSDGQISFASSVQGVQGKYAVALLRSK